MADGSYIVALQGIDTTAQSFDAIPRDVERFARMAINKTAQRARTDSSRRIREQVAFSAQYLSDAQGRLSITKPATEGDLEARITGRFRPTSLARFITGNPAPGRQGVNVRVKPGLARFMRRAFVIKLRSGSSDIETKFNSGIAVRLKPGETIDHKKKLLSRSGNSNLYLLYGPQVSQLFETVANDVSPESADFLEAEFLRLLNL